MERIVFAGWILEADRDATERAHAARARGASERCGCAPCRNFAVARTVGFGPEMRQLLARLGVPPDREAELRDEGPAGRPGYRRYHGCYLAVGRIAHDPLVDDDQAGEAVIELSRSLRIFIAAWGPVDVAGFDGLDVLRVEFDAELPWLLEEAMPAR